MADPLATDPLSNKARAVLRMNAAQAYANLVPRVAGDGEAGDLLHTLSPADLLTSPPADGDAAAGLLAGLWLWHDYLDESHNVSQQVETADGSYWHAIMHRREGDFGNAKYWYARCRNHPIGDAIVMNARVVLASAPADKTSLRLTYDGWNPAAFVDFVQSVHESPSDPRYGVAVALQQLEWRLLFDHCTRKAAGTI
jgi:hypothetical protein